MPTLHQLVGNCNPETVAAFKTAIKKQDPNSIATATARLVAESNRATLTLYHAAAFTPFVARYARRTLSYQQRRQLALVEWKRLARKRSFPSDPELKRVILSAVTRSLR